MYVNRTCKNCIFGDTCVAGRLCKHFSPLLDDEYSEEEEARDRREYYQAWLEYIDEIR